MTVRNSNLLLSDAAQPADGINYAEAKMWYGGPLSIKVTGEFSGAVVTLLASPNLPDQSLVDDDTTYASLFEDTDWVELADFAQNDLYNDDNLNPCLLAVRVNNPDTDTRIQAIIF